MTLKYAKKEASCLENKGFKEQHSRESPQFPYCGSHIQKRMLQNLQTHNYPPKEKSLASPSQSTSKKIA